MKYIFVGTQSTGKSTILRQFQSEYNVITEVVRRLAKEGVKINEMGDEEGQWAIFNEYKKLFSEQDNYISDRGLVDVCAYTKYLVDQGSIDESIYTEQLKQLKEFVRDVQATYFYFPIEFPVVADGVRSVDENFRKAIDENIRAIMKEAKINHVIITGSVEHRVSIVKECMLAKY
ncbi:MAG: ATP-binding protein [Parabacteroides sp.]|nr:ATP-binding protein [Parabacteroides sp.]